MKKGKISAEKEEELRDASKSRFHQAQEEYDENEPVYCLCRLVNKVYICESIQWLTTDICLINSKVAYGKMVGCSNDNCDIEWFHYDCVGIPLDEDEKVEHVYHNKLCFSV